MKMGIINASGSVIPLINNKHKKHHHEFEDMPPNSV